MDSGEATIVFNEGHLTVGGMFGGYRVERMLGKGGMGAVYLVSVPGTSLEFAAKIMSPVDDGERAEEWRKRFANEASFAMKMRHRNLVGVQDVGEDPETGLCYIIMDYMPGGSLADRIKAKGRLDIKASVAIVSQLADALAMAHGSGVVHRDIKPDNIMFDAEGTPRIADLGVAKFSKSGGNTTVTRTGMIVGTPAYMSPEQMMDSHSVDARSDIYSLGLVLYEMLTGERPNANSTVVELLAKAINGEKLPDIRTLRPEVSAALSYAISLMCAPKPEERPASMTEVSSLLESAISGKLKVPKEFRRVRVQNGTRGRPPSRRRALAVFAGVALCAAAAAAVGIMFIGARGAKRGVTDSVLRRCAVGEHMWTYCLENGEAVLMRADGKYTGDSLPCVSPVPSGTLEIPAQVDGYRVAALGEFALADMNGSMAVTGVTLPEGLRELRGGALAGCRKIAALTLPNSVASVGKGAFASCSALRRIDISMCAKISGDAFLDCASLEEIAVAQDNPAYTVLNRALYSKDGRLLVAYPKTEGALVMANGVAIVGQSAFASCRHRSMHIPEGVLSIEDEAFQGCRELEEVNLPASLTDMHDRAFAGCEKLVRLAFRGNAPLRFGKGLFDGAPESLAVEVERDSVGWLLSSLATLPERWPANASWPREATRTIRYVGETPEQIRERRARDGVSEIQSTIHGGYKWTYRVANAGKTRVALMGVSPTPRDAFAIPATLNGKAVDRVSRQVFEGCSEVTSIYIPEGVREIYGVAAFKDCAMLKSISLPKSLKKLGASPFRDCRSLETIDASSLGDRYRSSDGALYSADLKSLVAYPGARQQPEVRRGTEKIVTGAFCAGRCRSVRLVEGVAEFEPSVFEGCADLELVELPASMTNLSHWTFKDCVALRKIVFHGDAPAYGGGIFDGACSSLVIEVERGSKGWLKPGSDELPEFWPAGERAAAREIRFAGESAEAAKARRSLAGIKLQTEGEDKVSVATSDGMSWFYRMDGENAVLTALPENDLPCVWPKPVGRLTLPAELDGHPVTAIGAEAFSGCANLTHVVLPEGLKEIRGDGAFRGCRSLCEIKFPESLEKVEGRAFDGCFSLKRIDIGCCASFSAEALRSCLMLESIDASPRNKAYSVRDGALYGDGGATLVAYPKARGIARLPDGVTRVAAYAMSDGAYRDVRMPDGLREICEGALEGCRALETVEMPASLKTIGDGALRDCVALKKAILHCNAPETNPAAFAGANTEAIIEVERGSKGWSRKDLARLPLRWPTAASAASLEVRHIGESPRDAAERRSREEAARREEAMVRTCKVGANTWRYTREDGRAVLHRSEKSVAPCVEPLPRGRVVIPAELDGHAVFAIGDAAFRGCTAMTEIVMPEGLERIGADAFSGCYSLRKVELPQSVTVVGERAFSQCSSLKSADLGRCQDVSPTGVFAYCPSLDRIQVNKTNKHYMSLGGSLFTKDGKRLVAAAGAKGTVKLPDGVEEICSHAFCGSRIASLTMPKSLQRIGSCAFMDCKRLDIVRFKGRSPSVPSGGGRIFDGANEDAIIEIDKRNAKGWRDAATGDTLAAWPAAPGARSLPVKKSL